VKNNKQNRHLLRMCLCVVPLFAVALNGCGGGGGGGTPTSASSTTSSSSSSIPATGFVGQSEFLVNTATDNDQLDQRSTTLNNGNLVVAWVTSLGTVGGVPLSEIRAQIFTPTGAKIGSEIVVSSSTATSSNSNRHLQPNITALNDGGFSISWLSNGQLTTTPANALTQGPIFFRSFAANGTPTSDAEVPPLTSLSSSSGALSGSAGSQINLDFKTLSDGRLIVAYTEWSNTSFGDGNSFAVKAQLYSADGDELAPAFVVNTQTIGQQDFPRIGILSNGGFVVTWRDFNGSSPSGTVAKLKAQIYNATGAKVGSELTIRDTTLIQSTGNVTGLDNGQFVVAWSEGTGNGSTEDDAYAQIFNNSGTTVGPPFVLATSTSGRQVGPTLTSLPNGQFVAVWVDTSGVLGDTDGFGLKGQVFSNTGAKVAGEFLINSITTGNQNRPFVTALKTNGFLVTWTDASATLGDASGTSIKGRIFNLN
jgi:hypothetical protein